MKKYFLLLLIACCVVFSSACSTQIKFIGKAQETTEDMSKYGAISSENSSETTKAESDLAESSASDNQSSSLQSQTTEINSESPAQTQDSPSVNPMETPITVTIVTPVTPSQTTVPETTTSPATTVPVVTQPAVTTQAREKGGLQIPRDRSQTAKYNNVLFIKMDQKVIALNDCDVITGPGFPSAENGYSVYGKIGKGTALTVSGISYTGWVSFSIGDDKVYFIYNSNLSPSN